MRPARDVARLGVKRDRSIAGVDIVQEKRAAREEAKAVEIELTLPSEGCAETYIREYWPNWSKKLRHQWPSSLKRYADPTIGNLTIPEIKRSHVYELSRPIRVEGRRGASIKWRIYQMVDDGEGEPGIKCSAAGKSLTGYAELWGYRTDSRDKE